MKIYMIECEWDMGFSQAYATKERAMQAISNIDWIEAVESSIEDLFEDGLLEIIEVEVVE